MRSFITQILSGKDNKTLDAGRILWVISVFVYLGLAILSAIQGQQWHPMEFGTGLAATLAGGGAGIGMKAHTEPQGNDEHD